MMKSIGLILALAAGLMMALVTAAEAGTGTDVSAPPEFDGAGTSGPVILHDMVSIADDVIYLGDLFMNVDSRLVNRVVAYAPDPGRQATYGAQWLYRVARYFKLDWRPKTARDQTIITRESIMIDHDQIKETIMMHLVDQGVDPEMDAELANRNLRLYLPVTSVPEIAIDDLKYDEKTKRFSVTISAPDADRAFSMRSKVSYLPVPIMSLELSLIDPIFSVSSFEIVSCDIFPSL